MLSDFVRLIDHKTQTRPVDVPTGLRDDALMVALARYDRDRPRSRLADMLSTGAALQPVPDGWQAGVSRLISVELLPVTVPPSLLATGSVTVVADPEGEQLGFVTPPPVGTGMRVGFTAPHLLSDSADTIPMADRELVAALAAAEILEALANRHSGEHDLLIGGDKVPGESRSKQYRLAAAAARQRYEAAFPPAQTGQGPVSQIIAVTPGKGQRPAGIFRRRL